jgi:uncharacterized protein (TIRG00374 family)
VLYRIDLKTVVAAIGGLSARSLLLVAALGVSVTVVKAIRWHALLGAMNVRDSLGANVRVAFNGLFWGAISPGKLGEFKKAWALNARHGVGLSGGLLLCLMERCFDLMAVVLMGSVALVAADGVGVALVAPKWLIPLTLVCLPPCAVAGRFALGRLLRIAAMLRPRSQSLRGLMEDWRQLTNRSFLSVFALTMASMLLYVAMLRILAGDLPFEITFGDAFITVALTLLSGSLPVSFFNLGTREVVLIGYFAAKGLPAESAVAYSGVFMIITVMVVLITAVEAWLAGMLPVAGADSTAE